MLDRVFSALVAVSLAMLVWLYARSREQEMLDNVPIPVAVTLAVNQADNYVLEINGPSQVLVSFSGPPPRIRELRGIVQRGELHIDLTYTVPEERLQESRLADTLLVDASDVPAPTGISVMPVEGRNRVPLTLHRLVERRLPVVFDHGPFDSSMPVDIEPASVMVRGPQDVLDRARAIPTQPSALPMPSVGSPATVTSVGRVRLVEQLEGRPIQVSPNRVTVRIQPQARKVYELPDLPVHFLCPANLGLRPRFIDERSGKISLKVQGPAQDDPPVVYAFVDLTRGRFAAGLNHEQVQLQLPKDFVVAAGKPRVVAFELLPIHLAP
jgi:hypothetical protein